MYAVCVYIYINTSGIYRYIYISKCTCRYLPLCNNRSKFRASLEVELPTVWTDEKQRWEESEKRREEKKRREERESLRRKKTQVSEKVGK